MPDWLYPIPRRPRVALTLGASVRAFLSVDWGYVAVLLEALSGLDVEVVATLNDAQLASVPKVPDNVRVVEWVPLDYLAPTCSAMIHHGGIGTMASAASACIPQLVVDFPEHEFEERDFIVKGSDQVGKLRYVLGPLTGEYVTRLGAGEVLDMGKPSVETIREQITRVLTDPSVQEGAARVREDLLMTPSPSEVVGRLERVHFASAG
jgi:glycosyltransferase